MEIRPNTKVNDLLNAYPELEAFLMKLNPKYKKLKNPILRRTVARIATLTQVAGIGGYETLELVNLLRKEVGQPPLDASGHPKETEETRKAPQWLQNEPKTILDANQLLDEEKNPLAEVSKVLKTLDSGEIVMIRSDFLPSPLIDTFKEQGYDVYASEAEKGRFLTYIRKP
ncbi:DUF1858 domain-containing protein [Hydrogenimonas urashimensis]|uniref:DUF1858 domain-containing protein n=1 Tax=Hydrogenimonas urashimensis TaxID=2740515 RepID=UPI00191522C2|nr:DUF1858 domain-containing protein [Hydrogenimonas urashimensis]